MPPNTHIVRGKLSLWPYNNYTHSWLEIPINKHIYVFDPCLNYLCLKEAYYNIYEVRVLNKIPCFILKEELIKLLQEHKEKTFEIDGCNDMSSPFFRTNSLVQGVLRKDDIKILRVKYNNM